MKAAILHEYRAPLRLEETATPEPGPHDVLIKVEACGVCHSDLHLAKGDWQAMKKAVRLPLILGHEVAGRVVARGEEVTELEVGNRAGVAWLHWACGECAACLKGYENLCSKQLITGATVDGGFAEFIRARASHAVRIPDALDDIEAAPLFCAGVTVYRAIKNAGVRPGHRVAIFGVGGLGHLGIQIVQAFGGNVIAIDVSEEKLAFARELGASETMLAEGAGSVLRKQGGVDVAVVTSAAKAAYDAAAYGLGPGGTLAIVGLPAEDLSFQAMMLVGREARIVATATGTRDDLRDVVSLAASGKLRCRIETRKLEDINDTFDEMRQSRIPGRVVVTM